jgi:hypothetical protein
MKNKTFIFFAIFLLSVLSHAQITITSAHMPSPGEQAPVSMRTTPGSAITGHTLNGAGVTWDFSNITKQEQQIRSYISPTSSSIQFLCIAIFNNPLDPAHNATVARAGESMSPPMGTIQITDVYEFFQNNSQSYNLVGRSSSLNGTPTCVRNVPVDTIYKFPLEYGNSHTSFSAFDINIPTIGYYGQTQTRYSIADGWGTIITPFGTFDALRIKSVLDIVDTLYYDSMGFGFKFPHTETHYTWLTNDHKIPVFAVEEKGQNFGGTIAYWIDTLNNTGINNLSATFPFEAFPNPASQSITVNINDPELYGKKIILIDLNGKEYLNIVMTRSATEISLTGIPAGVYLLKTEDSAEVMKILIY